MKKANSVFLQAVIVGKVTYINIGIALIPVVSVTIQQLKKYSEKLVQAFEEYQVEQNKK